MMTYRFRIMSVRIAGIFVLQIVFMAKLSAQVKTPVYTKASSLTITGKIFPHTTEFNRVDSAEYPALPRSVKRLLTHSAGMAISFVTNSSTISAKWCVTDAAPYTNMTSIANKGLDLYIKNDGKWQFAGAGRPEARCSEAVIVKNMDSSEKECLLYLPLYDKVSDVEIGIDDGSTIKAGAEPFRKRILIYGSSIVQGSSASRPGMAYPARLSRATGLNFINMGLSGSAKMEKAAADLVASVDADAFVLDCIPNPSPEEIKQRTAYLVNAIRAKHPSAPIILVQSVIREHGYFDQKVGERVRQQNENARKEFELLQQKGVKNIYFIPADQLLGDDHEGTTDGTHPNDIGFDRMLQVLKPAILDILTKHGIL